MVETVLIHTKYGSIKPGEYKVVGRGYDYYEIKWHGTNICVPECCVNGERGV